MKTSMMIRYFRLFCSFGLFTLAAMLVNAQTTIPVVTLASSAAITVTSDGTTNNDTTNQATFSVTASGLPSSYTYAWQFCKTSNISNGTCSSWQSFTTAASGGSSSTVVTKGLLPTANGYQFRAAVTNTVGTGYSAPFTVTVDSVPVATLASSASVTVTSDGTTNNDTTNQATFSITASGLPADNSPTTVGSYTYAWQYCTAANISSGTCTSWQSYAAAASGGSSATMITSGLLVGTNGYQFRAAVTNTVGTGYSAPFTVTVDSVPVVTLASSASVTVTSDGTTNNDTTNQATFSITASGLPADNSPTTVGSYTYAWQFCKTSNISNGTCSSWQSFTTAASGGSSATVITKGLMPTANGYQFRAAVTNTVGTGYSAPFTVTVDSVPVVTLASSASVTVTSDGTINNDTMNQAIFSVTASGLPVDNSPSTVGSYTYAWQFCKASNITNGTCISWQSYTTATSGGSSATVTTRGLLPTANGYQFRAAVTNTIGTGYSAPFTLKVLITPVITWAVPSSIAYGTALSSTQLNATATFLGVTVPGTFVYTPASTTVLSAGSHTLSVTFTPSDLTTYVVASQTVKLWITKVTPTITINSPLPTPNYSAETIDLSALAASTISSDAGNPMPIVYSPLTPAICSVSSTTAHILAAGTCTIQAAQAATTDYNAASTTASITVGGLATTVTPSVSGAPYTYSDAEQTVSFSATVAGTPTPTGSVTFTVTSGGNTICTSPVATLASGTASGSCTLPAGQAAGAYHVNASYSGDTNYGSASSSTPSTLTVNAANTKVAVWTTGGPYTYTSSGVQLNLSASVKLVSDNSVISDAASAVSFTVLNSGSTSVCTPTTTTLSSGIFSSTCTVSAANSVNGTYSISAAYTPVSSNYSSSNSSAGSVTISKATPTITFTPPSSEPYANSGTFTVSASSSNSADTANASPITFTSQTSGVCSVATVLSVTTVTIATAGTCTIQASQASNSYYNAASTSGSTAIGQVATTISEAAPASRSYATWAQSVSLSATVKDSTGTTTLTGATGTITFTAYDSTCTNVLGAAVEGAVSSGVANATYILPASTTAGSYCVKALYSGDTDFVASSSGAQTLTVAQALNHFTVVPASSLTRPGSPVSVTVSAYDAHGDLLTSFSPSPNNVTLTASGNAVFSQTTLSSFSGGQATASVTFPAAGSYTVTATDGSASGTSATINVTAVPLFVVTTTADNESNYLHCSEQYVAGTGADGHCTLRDALAAAVQAGAGSISFDSSAFASQQTITEANGTLTVPPYTSITGPSTAGLTVTGTAGAPVFTVASTNTALGNLTITGGNGGIVNSGALTLTDVTISGNTAAVNGGGIDNTGTLTVIESTIADNTATAGYGGGIDNESTGTLTLTNVTISANSTGGSNAGNGIYNANSGSNSVTLYNSIVSANTAEDDYDGVSSISTSSTGNVVGSDTAIKLANGDTLSSYGGPTATILPMPGSAAICAGQYAQVLAANNPSLPANLTTDQRGVVMQSGGAGGYCAAGYVDAGAVQTDYALSFAPQQPSAVVVNATMSPSPAVKLLENGVAFADGTDTTSILLTLPGVEGTLTGGSAATSASTGIATYAGISIDTAGTPDTLTANLTLNGSIAISKTSSNFTVNQAVPAVTWVGPSSPIAFGTNLSGILDAVATDPNTSALLNSGGTWAYTATPSLGSPQTVTSATVLHVGTYTLTAYFTPTSLSEVTDYTSTGYTTTHVTVSPATPTVTVASLTSVPFGTKGLVTLLSATAKNPTDSHALTDSGWAYTYTGTVNSSPVSGTLTDTTLLHAGSYTLTATFTAPNSTDYNQAGSSSTSLTVSPATPTVSVSSLSAVTYGTQASTLFSSLAAVAQNLLDGHTLTEGHFAYTYTGTVNSSPVSGTLTGTTVLDAGTYSLTATYIPNNTTDYNSTGSASTSLTINQASQSITITGAPTIATFYTQGGNNVIHLASYASGTNSGNALTYSFASGLTISTSTSNATLSGSDLTLTGTGPVTVYVNQPVSTDYSAATQQSLTITIYAQPIITDFLANGVSPLTATIGSTVTLTSDFTGGSDSTGVITCVKSDATTCTVSSATGLSTGFSVTNSPAANVTTIYTLTVTNGDGVQATATVVVVTPEGTWTAVSANSPFNTLTSNALSALLPSGAFWTAGGSASDAAVEYDNLFTYSNSGTPWSTDGASGAELMQNNHFNGTATLLANGKVLIAGGGAVGGSANNTVELYNPAGPSSVFYTNLPSTGWSQNTANQAATLLPNGNVLLAGGWDEGSVSPHYWNTVWSYNPTSQSITKSVSTLGTARYGSTATTLLDGRVLIAGGTASAATVSNAVDIYDSVNDLNPSDTLSYYDPYATVDSGSLYTASNDVVSGSATFDAMFSGNCSASLIGGFTSPCLNSARQYHTATLLPTGEVLIAGGTNGTNPVASLEIFDPTANGGAGGFTTLNNSMSVAREKHSAVLLGSGGVLIFGGDSDGSTPLSLAEIITISRTGSAGSYSYTDTTAPAVNLNTARELAASTLQSDGTVFTAGGTGTSDKGEIYSATSPTDYTPSVSAPTSGTVTISGLTNGNVSGGSSHTASMTGATGSALRYAWTITNGTITPGTFTTGVDGAGTSSINFTVNNSGGAHVVATVTAIDVYGRVASSSNTNTIVIATAAPAVTSVAIASINNSSISNYVMAGTAGQTATCNFTGGPTIPSNMTIGWTISNGTFAGSVTTATSNSSNTINFTPSSTAGQTVTVGCAVYNQLNSPGTSASATATVVAQPTAPTLALTTATGISSPSTGVDASTSGNAFTLTTSTTDLGMTWDCSASNADALAALSAASSATSGSLSSTLTNVTFTAPSSSTGLNFSCKVSNAAGYSTSAGALSLSVVAGPPTNTTVSITSYDSGSIHNNVTAGESGQAAACSSSIPSGGSIAWTISNGTINGSQLGTSISFTPTSTAGATVSVSCTISNSLHAAGNTANATATVVAQPTAPTLTLTTATGISSPSTTVDSNTTGNVFTLATSLAEVGMTYSCSDSPSGYIVGESSGTITGTLNGTSTNVTFSAPSSGTTLGITCTISNAAGYTTTQGSLSLTTDPTPPSASIAIVNVDNSGQSSPAYVTAGKDGQQATCTPGGSATGSTINWLLTNATVDANSSTSYNSGTTSTITFKPTSTTGAMVTVACSYANALGVSGTAGSASVTTVASPVTPTLALTTAVGNNVPSGTVNAYSAGNQVTLSASSTNQGAAIICGTGTDVNSTSGGSNSAAESAITTGPDANLIGNSSIITFTAPTSSTTLDFQCYLQNLAGLKGTWSSTLPITVNALQSIAVTPSRLFLAPGVTQQFTALGNFGMNGSATITSDLSSQVAWVSGNTNLATVSEGAVTISAIGSGDAPGVTNISATLGGNTGSTQITVGAWTGAAGMLTAPTAVAEPRYNALSLMLNNKFWVAGGEKTTGLLADYDQYSNYSSASPFVYENSASTYGTWANGGSASQYQFAAGPHLNGTASADTYLDGDYPGWAILVGGESASGVANTGIELFNPKAKSPLGFSLDSDADYYGLDQGASTTLPVATTGHVASFLTTGPNANSLLIAGGWDGSSNYYSNAYLYSPDGPDGPLAENAYLVNSDCALSVARYGATATALSDRILIAGGVYNNEGTGQSSSAVDLYFPEIVGSNEADTCAAYPLAGTTWTTTATQTGLINARSNHTATLLSDGRVLFAGGVNASGNVMNSLEVYDPAANSNAGGFISFGSMQNYRASHSAVLLGNGMVLIFGGVGGSSTTAFTSSTSLLTAEVFNPDYIADGWPSPTMPVSSLNHDRSQASAVLLSGTSVNVLATGGLSNTSTATALSSAEIFTTSNIIPILTWNVSQTTYTVETGTFSVAGDAASASSGAVTYNSQTPGVCTTSGTHGATVTLQSSGACIIQASQAAAGEFDAPLSVNQSFTVNP